MARGLYGMNRKPKPRKHKKTVVRKVFIEHRALLIAQQNKCWICGRYMSHSDPANWHYRSVDHIRPKSLLVGLKSHHWRRQNNTMFACRGCNNSRKNDLPSSYQQYRLKMLQIKAIAVMLAK